MFSLVSAKKASPPVPKAMSIKFPPPPPARQKALAALRSGHMGMLIQPMTTEIATKRVRRSWTDKLQLWGRAYQKRGSSMSAARRSIEAPLPKHPATRPCGVGRKRSVLSKETLPCRSAHFTPHPFSPALTSSWNPESGSPGSPVAVLEGYPDTSLVGDAAFLA